ncbi:MAG: sensor histidine kinase [Sphingomonas bacterium]|uniref:PAS domain-containing sensor histidine kinase n=1 Tax=Sphingomonas bacterium TaxID=1895847 RepID=UPI002609C919|nr:PAS domain S-box protein [Sphingomonas bacterium]MDB5703937.1 sensor histidine kinase [Sphingomonas bacterium]
MREKSDARPTNDASGERKVVLGLVSIAALISATAFAGWVFDVPALKGFGIDTYPMWPITALGFASLSLGFVVTVLGYRIATMLIALPLLIATYTLLAGATGISLGLDTLLFPDQVQAIAVAQPGRPGANSMAVFAFIGLALLSSMRRSHAFAELANLLATAALCFGVFSLFMLSPLTSADGLLAQIFASPLAGSLATIALATAFLLWRHEAGWMLLLTATRGRRRLVVLILPIVIILPILPTLVERWGMETVKGAPIETELIAVLGNVAIIGFLVWLAVDRLTRQQGALQEVTVALDITAVTLTRPDGEITYWSRGCERLYGWPAVEAIGRKKYELLKSRLGKAASSGVPRPTGAAEHELVECRRDGTEISVLERTQVLERPDREPLLVVKMLDISERVQAEGALRMSEARLAAAADAHQLGVSQWDVKTGLIEWSPGSEQRLGLPAGGLATFDHWFTFVDQEDAQGVMATLERAVANQDDRVGFKYRFRQPDGVVRTIEGSARCYYDERGELETVIGANVDITERNEREAASQLRSIIETIPDATVVIDSSGTIRSFSAGAERMFGVDSAVAIGRNIRFLMPDSIAAGHDDSIARYLATGKRHVIGTTRDLTAKRADGVLFPIELSLGEAWLGNERIFTGVIRDVSDRLAAEQRLSELNAELAHISRQNAMSELAADLAHELNQPLSATANFLAAARMLIERGEDGGKVADLLRMGEEQTLRSGEIIRRLRDFLTKREGEMRAESLELVVREAVELVLFGTAQFGIKLTYLLDTSADTIFADRIQVQQVLVNLLRNAVDALRNQPSDGREIVIASRPAGDDMIEISVSDNGPGLPAELSEQLYSRFATTKNGTAMGIGLSISRRIVEAHGGTLVAENRPNGGAVFRFTLPALEEIEE